MKNLKMFGLVAVAALALIAIVGAGSASATALCKENVKECPAEKKYGVGQAFKSSLEVETSATLNAGLNHITCEKSTLDGSITNAGGAGAPVIIKIETLSFQCNCPITTLKTGTMSVEWTPGTANGGATLANTKITFNCMGHCEYGEGPFGAVTGGAMGTIDVEAEMKKIAGGVACPAFATLEAAYTITTPEPLYVSEK